MLRGRAIAALFLSATTLGGCLHGTSPPITLRPSAANFTYYTPTTRLKLSGNLVLLRCEPGPRGIVASSNLALAASAEPDLAAPFALDGASLMSAMQRRELGIELYDNGTLKSVNATATDRSGAVLTNLLKTIASIAGAVAGVPTATATGQARRSLPNPCNDETMEALRRARQFRNALDALRASLVNASPEQVESIGARMELIANQLASLITTRLTITVSKPVDLGTGPTPPGESPSIRWTFGDLRQWFGNPDQPWSCTPVPGALHLFSGDGSNACEHTTDLLAVSYTVTAEDVAEPAARIARSPCRALSPNPAPECGRTIVMPRPARATVIMRTAAGNVAGLEPGDTLTRAVIAVPQWGEATYLPVNVRAFQSRSIGFTYNAFGERRSFKWNSEATAENATAALVSAAEAGAGIVDTVGGQTDTERLTAQNAELEARMANNRLRLCEQAILAGATTCDLPDEED